MRAATTPRSTCGGIGSGNTLVLVNGRRLAPHPISQAEGGVPSLAVNINQLPTAAIQRVEILRDGASAIYGADAAAGVVNAILRRDPPGIDGTDDNSIHVGVDNPFNPFGSRYYHPTGAPNADGTARIAGTPVPVMVAGGTGARPREFKAREINVLSQSFRGVAGLRGATFGDFEWESGVMYARAWTRDEEGNSIRHSLLQAAMLRTDNTAFNPFGYTFRNVGGSIRIDEPYTNPASVVDPPQQLDESSAVETILEEDGRAKWRGNLSVSWRQGNWGAGWFAEYYGGSMDPGGSATATVYEKLGQPDYIKVFHDVGGVIRYRWWIEDVIQQNIYGHYRFENRGGLLRNVTARFGVINLADEEPPVADESRGYQGGTVSAKGRSFYLEISKRL